MRELDCTKRYPYEECPQKMCVLRTKNTLSLCFMYIKHIFSVDIPHRVSTIILIDMRYANIDHPLYDSSSRKK